MTPDAAIPEIISIDESSGEAEALRVDAARLAPGSPNPTQTARNLFTDSTGRFFSGIWSSTRGAWRVAYTENELCVLTHGKVRITAGSGRSWTFGPGESGPDPHFHRAITESFYVLRGEVDLYDGSRWRTARTGDFLFVPQGGLHGFRGSDHAQMLLVFTPGAPREDYFETLAAHAPMGEEERAEFMLRHDTYWV